MILRQQIYVVLPRRRGTRIRCDDYWRWLRSTMGWTERRRRGLAAWIASRCETGRIASMNMAPLALSMSNQRGVGRSCRWSNKRHGVVRWRCVDLQRVLGAQFGVDLSTVAIGRQLKRLGFSHISARPLHPAQDAQAITAFKKTSPLWSQRL